MFKITFKYFELNRLNKLIYFKLDTKFTIRFR